LNNTIKKPHQNPLGFKDKHRDKQREATLFFTML
jgi:hypothetical protein